MLTSESPDEGLMARSESVTPVNFARESNGLQVWQWAMLDVLLDEVLDVFSTLIWEAIGTPVVVKD
jgi:hypothetical protein